VTTQLADNVLEGAPPMAHDSSLLSVRDGGTLTIRKETFDLEAPAAISASAAYALAPKQAGCTKPVRDAVDRHITPASRMERDASWHRPTPPIHRPRTKNPALFVAPPLSLCLRLVHRKCRHST
jgi:hypothetical protein